MIFFTLPKLYGERIVAIETGRIKDENYATVRKQIDNAIQKLSDKDILNKINRSAIVLVGEISDVHEREKTKDEPQKEGSELDNVDDPIYGEATINVVEVLKGESSMSATNKILFNTNPDHVLEQLPNYKPGDHGIFFLQENKIIGTDKIKYILLRTGDFKPIYPGEKDILITRVKLLINSAGSASEVAGGNLK